MRLPNSKEKISGSKILLSLIAGFISILIAMMLTWYISVSQMTYVSEVINNSKTVAGKMDLVASLTEVARSRTRLTMRMIHTEDPFERDEIGLELNNKATEFAVLREQLFNLGLSEPEINAFKQLSEYVKPALERQRFAANLALSDDPHDKHRASQILLTEVYPRQGIIVDMFMQMLREQKKQLETSGQLALEQIEVNRNLDYIIFAIVLVISVIIITLVIRHIISTADTLKNEKDKAQDTIRSLGDAVITTDRQGVIEYLNNTAETLIGKRSSELIGKNLKEGFPAYDKDKNIWVWQAANKLVSGEDMAPLSRHITLFSFEKMEYEITVAISPIIDIHGKTSGVIVSFHDVTQSRQLMKKIKHQAEHDALTGLLNRREFKNRVSSALALYENSSTHAMCVIDLDSFKVVNDSCGHAAGDKLLKQLADYLKHRLRKSDFFARMGGDEFAIFFSNIQLDEANRITTILLDAIKEFQFIWEGKTFRIGASIGMIEIPQSFTDYEYLYKAADTACYLAKDAGRNQIKTVAVDDSTLTQKSIESNWIEQINYALSENKFLLFTQPIESISLRTQGRKHTEILLRMQSNEGVIISPMAFIPVAERYSMMDKIDMWVFKRVCQHIVDTPLDHTVFAVNLSGQTLSSLENMQQLKEIAENLQLPPGRLCLEITETVAIANIELARQFMESMQVLGCYIALDDFGSGLSSFSYLKDLPLDYIKIDGSFVKSITKDKSSLVMVDAINNVGKKLGLITIAEYVESEEILRELQKVGIDMAQGYFLGKPQALEII